MKRIGDALCDRGLHPSAEEWWRPAAEAGHQPSMVALAALARVRRSIADARFWYSEAVTADPRDVSSLRSLGMIGLELGDTALAEQWLSRAAELGDGEAMIELAYLCRRHRDWSGAARWMMRAGQVQFDGWAEVQGLLAEPGFTVTPDLADGIGALLVRQFGGRGAEPWLRIAADAGITAAQTDLAVILYRRNDVTSAQRLLLAAAEAGDRDAMYNYGRIREANRDVATARGWYARATELGDTEAANRLARIHSADDSEPRALHLRCAVRQVVSR